MPTKHGAPNHKSWNLNYTLNTIGRSVDPPTLPYNAVYLLFFGLYNDQLQRTHDQASQSSSQTEPPWRTTHPQPSTSLYQSNSSPISFSVPNLRYEADGLDFRRPIMSTTPQEIIDLTGDGSGQPRRRLRRTAELRPAFRRPGTPSPQAVRDIISIDDYDDAAGGRISGSSPELEFMFARTLLPTTMPYSRPDGVRSRGTGPSGAGELDNPPILPIPNSGQSGVDNLSWAEWRNQGLSRIQSRANAMRNEEYYRQRSRQQEAQHRVPHNLQAHIMGEIFNNRDPMFMNAPEMDLPDQLNFYTQGFAMGPGGQAGGNVRARPPPPTYDAPSPPRAGYTRTPREEDILLCPNCEQELGIGDTDLKKQVWVIKKCGHVRTDLIYYLNVRRAN